MDDIYRSSGRGLLCFFVLGMLVSSCIHRPNTKAKVSKIHVLWRIQHFRRGRQPRVGLGGGQLPMQLYFVKFVCQNERIGTRRVRPPPLDLPMMCAHN